MNLRSYLFLLLISTMTACGGGGGGTSVEVSSSTNTAFVAEKAATSGSVTLQEGSMIGDVLYVNVMVTDVNNVFSASMYIDYDPLIVNWNGTYTSGNFLEKNGDSPVYSLNLKNGIEGTLVIGVSLLNPATPVSGSGTLISIPFSTVAKGSSAVSFSNLQLFNSVPSEISVTSGGGTITVL